MPRGQDTPCGSFESFLLFIELDIVRLLTAAGDIGLMFRLWHTEGMATRLWRRACFGAVLGEMSPRGSTTEEDTLSTATVICSICSKTNCTPNYYLTHNAEDSRGRRMGWWWWKIGTRRGSRLGCSDARPPGSSCLGRNCVKHHFPRLFVDLSPLVAERHLLIRNGAENTSCLNICNTHGY